MGWISIIISNILINKLFENLGFEQNFLKFLIVIVTTLPFVTIILNYYNKIYIEIIGKDKNGKIDFLALLMDEAIYPTFFDAKLKGMKEYLHKEFNIHKREQIEDVINIAQKELNTKYSKKKFDRRFFE